MSISSFTPSQLAAAARSAQLELAIDAARGSSVS